MKVSTYSFNLPFRHPFTISRGTKTHQPSLVVELEHMGIKGYGEAPAIPYYKVTVDEMITCLEKKKQLVEKFAFTDPERFWHYLHHLFSENHFLVCALDMAGWDLYGKLRNKKLYELWALDISRNPVTDYTIGIDTVEKMISKIREKPWPVYKIKVGFEHDLEMIGEIRRHTDAVLRVDANGGWSVDEALRKIPALRELGVELVEQPLPGHEHDGMRRLFEHSPLPLFADESCVVEEDVEKCHGYFHGINIKLTKCSGITPARRMIRKARQLGMQVMMGCMSESTVGISAIAHFLPLLDHVDMDGPLLLEKDIADGIRFEYGKIIYTGLPGLGFRFNP